MQRALVIGIDDYPGAPLAGCVNDATRITDCLKYHGDGSPNFSVKLMTSTTQAITKPSLRQGIDALFAENAEVALLYFSGHGFINSSGGWIVTPDFRSGDEGILMDEILNAANRSSVRDKIIILDCCYSGAFGSPVATGGSLAQLSDGLTVLTASARQEPALEQNGQGVFTSLLVDGLSGGAADLRGNVTPGSLYAYVDEALGAWDQRPIFKTNVSRFTVLRRVLARVPLDVLRRIKDYFPQPTAAFVLDPSYEDTDPHANPEHVTIFKELQKYFSVGLVRPIGEEYMYFAAMNSKSCALTALGYQYWRLANEEKL